MDVLTEQNYGQYPFDVSNLAITEFLSKLADCLDFLDEEYKSPLSAYQIWEMKPSERVDALLENELNDALRDKLIKGIQSIASDLPAGLTKADLNSFFKVVSLVAPDGFGITIDKDKGFIKVETLNSKYNLFLFEVLAALTQHLNRISPMPGFNAFSVSFDINKINNAPVKANMVLADKDTLLVVQSTLKGREDVEKIVNANAFAPLFNEGFSYTAEQCKALIKSEMDNIISHDSSYLSQPEYRHTDETGGFEFSFECSLKAKRLLFALVQDMEAAFKETPEDQVDYNWLEDPELVDAAQQMIDDLAAAHIGFQSSYEAVSHLFDMHDGEHESLTLFLAHYVMTLNSHAPHPAEEMIAYDNSLGRQEYGNITTEVMEADSIFLYPLIQQILMVIDDNPGVEQMLFFRQDGSDHLDDYIKYSVAKNRIDIIDSIKVIKALMKHANKDELQPSMQF